MDDAKQQLIDKLKNANNILVTVSRNPSVDQLASCIGLTLLLNKQNKHAAAVFSGKPPSTLEFLKPEDTLEKNTDSLRDFIISLDKSKADKLRYKVEEDVVRIFITPYRTSLSEDDLQFSEGDFNVDVVVALGVKEQEDLDQAITAHGRILHDATVTSINISADGGLGSINWNSPQASSLSELVTDVAQALGPDLIDSQIATALLTGIVSETNRFSNDKTTPQTMSASAILMTAGANQQLVASELESGGHITPDGQQAGEPTEEGEGGVLEIDHAPDEAPPEAPAEAPVPDFSALPSEDTAGPSDINPPQPELPEQPEESKEPEKPETPESPPASTMSPGSKLVTEPPTMGGTLTANSQTERLDPVTDPFSLPKAEQPQILERKEKPATGDTGFAFTPPPTAWNPPPAPKPSQPSDSDDRTLTDIEKSVNSPHVQPADLEKVRDQVEEALSENPSSEPIQALNAQPLGNDLHPAGAGATTPPPFPSPPAQPSSSDNAVLPPQNDGQDSQQTTDSNAPPPVPPPIPFQFGNSSQQPDNN